MFTQGWCDPSVFVGFTKAACGFTQPGLFRLTAGTVVQDVVVHVRSASSAKMGSHVVTGETPLAYNVGVTTFDVTRGVATMRAGAGATGVRASREHEDTSIASAANVAKDRPAAARVSGWNGRRRKGVRMDIVGAPNVEGKRLTCIGGVISALRGAVDK